MGEGAFLLGVLLTFLVLLVLFALAAMSDGALLLGFLLFALLALFAVGGEEHGAFLLGLFLLTLLALFAIGGECKGTGDEDGTDGVDDQFHGFIGWCVRCFLREDYLDLTPQTVTLC